MNQGSKPVVAYKAIGKTFSDGGQCAATPRAAAASFFERFPNKRKCTVVKGVLDHGRFCEIYVLWGESCSSIHYRGVTRKTMLDLPNEAPAGEPVEEMALNDD